VETGRHPDLIGISRELRRQLDATLLAEQHAARAAAIRRTTLRDRMLNLADADSSALITTTDGNLHSGVVASVGADHITMTDEGTSRLVMLRSIVSVEVRS